MSKRRGTLGSGGGLDGLLEDVTGEPAPEPRGDGRSVVTQHNVTQHAITQSRRRIQSSSPAYVQYSIRFPPELLEEIRATARAMDGVTINGLVLDGARREIKRLRKL